MHDHGEQCVPAHTVAPATLLANPAGPDRDLSWLLSSSASGSVVVVDSDRSYLAHWAAEHWASASGARAVFVHCDVDDTARMSSIQRLVADAPSTDSSVPSADPESTTSGRVGVILIQFNAHDLTAACLESLYETTYSDKQVYLLENASSDLSTLQLFLEFPRLQVITAIARTSYCNAFNLLADIASRGGCAYLFFVNNDTRGFSPDLFEHLISDLSPEIALVSPRIYDFTQADIHWRPRTKWGISWDLATEAYLVDAAVWNRLGGFTSSFVMYCEDLDFLLRLRAIGMDARLNTDVKLDHMGGAAVRTMLFVPTFFYMRNLLWLQRRAFGKLGRSEVSNVAQSVRATVVQSASLLRSKEFTLGARKLAYVAAGLTAGVLTRPRDNRPGEMAESLRRSTWPLKFRIR
jgi:GT2 family glycosyltransferase